VRSWPRLTPDKLSACRETFLAPRGILLLSVFVIVESFLSSLLGEGELQPVDNTSLHTIQRIIDVDYLFDFAS
jgi:hypothetical protein